MVHIPDLSSDSEEEGAPQIPTIRQIRENVQRVRSRMEEEQRQNKELNSTLKETLKQKSHQTGNFGSFGNSGNSTGSINNNTFHFSSSTTSESATSTLNISGNSISISDETLFTTASSALSQSPNHNASQRQTLSQPIPASKNLIFAHIAQKANPILKNSKILRHIQFRNDLLPDYIITKEICIFYLSMKFHRTKPEYIANRLKSLNNLFSLRVLLLDVDLFKDRSQTQKNSSDSQDLNSSGGSDFANQHILDVNQGTEHHSDLSQKQAILEVTKVCLEYNATLLLSFSKRQAAQYIDMYREYAHTPKSVLKAKVDDDYLSMMQAVLTSVKSVNKTDVNSLIRNFGSFKSIVTSKKEDLLMCPGLGSRKCNELEAIFQAPFLRSGNSASQKSLSSRQIGLGKFMK